MAGPGLVAGDVVVDALPYFDQGYEAPGVREAAAALVEEETRRYRPTKNYLSYLPAHDFSAFETEIMRNEFERLAARQPLELLSMKRYELPAPSSGQKNDITAWQECVNNSMAQLEHQAVRIENLELMSQHGCNAWKVYNEPQGMSSTDCAENKLSGVCIETSGSYDRTSPERASEVEEKHSGSELATKEHATHSWGQAPRNGIHMGVSCQ
ncbi:pre-mRNA-splicing factor SPF27 isoform 2-T2 [Amazona ochrocephala]